MRRLVSRGYRFTRFHAVLLGNAGQLVIGSGINAVLGFAFWWLAARLFASAAVGVQSAVIAVMSFVGLFGEAGFGTLLLGEIRLMGANASPLIIAGSLAGASATLVLAVPTALVLAANDWTDTAATGLFILGCVLQGFALVMDQAFTGLLRSNLFLARNVGFALAKLLILAVVAILSRNQIVILAAWVAGIAASEAGVCLYAWRRAIITLSAPSIRPLVRHLRTVRDHHALNLAAAAPQLLLPVVVNLYLGPTVNAAFYIGWMIFVVATFVPASLTTVLFSMGAAPPSDFPRQLRFSFAASIGFALAASVLMPLFAEPILALFNPDFPALAASAMALFGLGLLGTGIKQHYILLARSQRRVMRAALWLTVIAGMELGCAATGGWRGNVFWLTVCWLIALTLSSAFLLGPVLRFCRLLPAAMAGRAAPRWWRSRCRSDLRITVLGHARTPQHGQRRAPRISKGESHDHPHQSPASNSSPSASA